MEDVRTAAARERFAAVVGGAFELSRRETRWLALGDDVVAFAADDDAGWRRLQSEAWLIDRWRAAGVPAPCVIGQDDGRRVQVLERVRGVTEHAIDRRLWPGAAPDAWARLDDAPLSDFGERFARSYGELARRIRDAVSVADASAAGFGPCSRRELDLDAAIARLHASEASPAAKAAAERLRPWLADLPPPDALIHSDLHFWNMCLADDGAIAGVFDLGGVGLDAAATELLIVHSLGARFARTAIAAYGPVDVEAVLRAHLRSALDHLIKYDPEEPPPSVVPWVSAAFERLTPF